MSQSVIDMFKIVQIHKQHGTFFFVPHRFTDNVAQIIFTFHTVIQTGQEIVMCLILDFLLVLFLLCYINRRADYCRIAV